MENITNILITVISSVDAKMLEIYDGIPATLTVVLNPDQDVALTASSQIDISFSPVATGTIALGTTPTGWIKGTDAGGVTLTCNSTKKWTKGEALSFTITNVNYSVGQSPVALDVTLLNINGSPFPVVPRPAITISVNAAPQPGGVPITDNLQISLFNNNSVKKLSNNTNAVLYVSPSIAPVNNSLFLSLTNIDAKPLFSGSASKGSPQVKIWFVYGTDSGCLAPAYTPPTKPPMPIPGDLANNIPCLINNDQGNSWQVLNRKPDPQDSSPKWLLAPSPNNLPIIGTDENNTITFEFQDILSFNDPGTTLVYIQFTGFWRDDETKYNDQTFELPLLMKPGPVITSFTGTVEPDDSLGLIWATTGSSFNGAFGSWNPNNPLLANPTAPIKIPPPLSITTYTLLAYNEDQVPSYAAILKPAYQSTYMGTLPNKDCITTSVAVNGNIIYLIAPSGNFYTYNTNTNSIETQPGAIVLPINQLNSVSFSKTLNCLYTYNVDLQFVQCNSDGTFNHIVDVTGGNITMQLAAVRNTANYIDSFEYYSYGIAYTGTGWCTYDNNNMTQQPTILKGSSQQPFFIMNTYDDSYFIVMLSNQFGLLQKDGDYSVKSSISLMHYGNFRTVTSTINYNTFVLDTTANCVTATNFIPTLPDFFNTIISPEHGETFFDIALTSDSKWLLVLSQNAILCINAITPSNDYSIIPITNSTDFVISNLTTMIVLAIGAVVVLANTSQSNILQLELTYP